MKPSPKFSFVIPSYNRAWILQKTLRDVLAQDYSDWELILVDDGSTDETKDLLQNFNDKRIRYIYQTNARQAAARQNGLEQARGEWIAYVDSDDEIYPHYLSTANAFFQKHPDVWYAFANNDRTLELHDENHRVLFSKKEAASQLKPESITLQSYAHWDIKPCGTGIFHRKDVVNDDIRWDTKLTLLEDIDFMFQLGLAYPEHFGFIPEPIFHQRQVFGNDGVCSGASYEDWANGFEAIFKKYKGSWLMEGQKWYPKKVQTYRERARLFKEGKFPSPVERIFPTFFHPLNQAY